MPDAEFVALPAQRLKGIPDPVRLIEVRPHSPIRANRETDPVCEMLVDPDVAIRTTWHGMTFAFCSEKCRQAFADNPSRFLTADRD